MQMLVSSGNTVCIKKDLLSAYQSAKIKYFMQMLLCSRTFEHFSLLVNLKEYLHRDL